MQVVIVVVVVDGDGLVERGVGARHCVKGWARRFIFPNLKIVTRSTRFEP